MFNTEHEMSLRFEKFVKVNFGQAYLKECNGLFGVPDFVCYDKNKDGVSIVAFELKLKDWRRAATQAFRYRSFSHIVYVVLPTEKNSVAMNQLDLFQKYNIGLATFGMEGFKILYKPHTTEPFSMDLLTKMADVVSKSKKKAKNLSSLAQNKKLSHLYIPSPVGK